MTLQGMAGDIHRPDGAPSPVTLREEAVQTFRWVIHDDQKCSVYADMLRSYGIVPVGVLDSDSIHGRPYREAALAIAYMVDCDYYVIGNEQDAHALEEESKYSWSMQPMEYAKLYIECREAILSVRPNANIVMGGLVSGQPWLGGVYTRVIHELGIRVKIADIHPWGRDTESAAKLLADYRLAMPGVSLAVLEWNRKAAEIPEYVTMLDQQKVEVSAYFARMQTDVNGLFTSAAEPTEEYHALVRSFKSRSIVVDIPEEVTMPSHPNDNVGEGVLARMEAVGDHPLTDEVYQYSEEEVVTHGYQWSITWGSQGRYISSNKSGTWEVAGPLA